MGNLPRLIFLALLLLPALPAPAAPFTYKDKLGRTVTIQTPVKRAVLYETYELIPLFGSWGQIAGISRYAYDNDLLLAVKPDIRRIPDAGSAFDLNPEVLLKLRPDLVMTWTVDQKAIHFLEQKGLPVIAVYPESVAELYEVMRLQGKLFGKEKQVEKVIGTMEAMFNLIRSRTRSIPPTARKKALYLTGKQTRVNGRIGITHDLFAMMGVENAAAEIGERSADVSLERIMGWNPDLVYIWGSARYSAADLVKNPQWRHIGAVRTGRLFKSPKWGTWSPRLAPTALLMASQAYPERFKDVDVTKTMDRFYRDVYGIPYAKVAQLEK
jgi:iron complex transport system substrate-binding protein